MNIWGPRTESCETRFRGEFGSPMPNASAWRQPPNNWPAERWKRWHRLSERKGFWGARRRLVAKKFDRSRHRAPGQARAIGRLVEILLPPSRM